MTGPPVHRRPGLADDPGAGKTIMAGLYITELLLRADLHRCLIVAPSAWWISADFRTVGWGQPIQGLSPA